MDSPLIMEPMQNITTIEGQTAKFRLKYYAKPPPKCVWLRNEKKLEKSDRVNWSFPQVKMRKTYIVRQPFADFYCHPAIAYMCFFMVDSCTY